MEIVTGYFISRSPAIKAAEYFRNDGFKGEIAVIGRHNEEDFHDTGYYRNNTDSLSMSGYFFVGGLASTNGLNNYTMTGSLPMVGAGPVISLINGDSSGDITRILAHWGIPKTQVEEIRSVVVGGSTVFLVECEENNREYIIKTLNDKGAQRIRKG